MKKYFDKIKRKIEIKKHLFIKKAKFLFKCIIDFLNNPHKWKQFIFFVKKKFNSLKNRYINSKSHFSFVLNIILGSRFSILLLIGLILFKTWIFYINIGLNDSDLKQTLFISIQFILIAICPLFYLKKDKNRFFGVLIYTTFFGLLLFIDNIYYEYSVNMLSISQIMYIRYAEEIGGTLPYLLDFWHLLYFIDIPILIILWYFVRKPIRRTKTRYLKNKGNRRLLFALLYTIIIIKVTKPGIDYAISQIEGFPYQKNVQVLVGSVYGYHYMDIYKTLHIKDTTVYKNYDQVMNAYTKLSDYYESNFSSIDDLYEIAKGKNVIVIQLESVQNFVINRTINGTEITPNLNKFLKENIEFTNMTVQSYSTTADSEYSVITSLYPLDNGQAFSSYYSNINNDIYSLYKNAGYTTSYMHGNINSFWNRSRCLFKT